MLKKLLVVLAAGVVLSSVVYAAGGEGVVGLNYGMLQTPSIEGGDGVTKGGIGLGFQYLVPSADGKWKYGAEIATMPLYNYKDLWGNEVSLNSIPIMGVAKYQVESSGEMKPYILGALGLCYTTVKVSVMGFSSSESKMYLGLSIGGGITTKLADKTDLDINLRYNRVNADEAASTISLGAGVAFGL